MQRHPEHSDPPQPPAGRRRVILGLGIAVILVIVVAVHLTGVVGAG